MLTEIRYGDFIEVPHDVHIGKHRAEQIDEWFDKAGLGDVDLTGLLRIHGQHLDEIGQSVRSAGATPDLSKPVEDAIRTKLGFLSAESKTEGDGKDASEYDPEDDDGKRSSAGVTGVAVDADLEAPEVFTLMLKNDTLKRAAKVLKRARTDSDPDMWTLLAYALWRFSRGWDAERVLVKSGMMTKGTEEQDKAGIDGWWGKSLLQVKPSTFVNSNSGAPEIWEEDVDKSGGYDGDYDFRHMFYMFGQEKMFLATATDFNEMTGKAQKEMGLKFKGHITKSQNLKKCPLYPRKFRHTWVETEE